jgi:hypothetical protein
MPDATDEWYAGFLRALDDLKADAQADADARAKPLTAAREARLLGLSLRGRPFGKGAVCDLLAVLMVDTMRTPALTDTQETDRA